MALTITVKDSVRTESYSSYRGNRGNENIPWRGVRIDEGHFGIRVSYHAFTDQ